MTARDRRRRFARALIVVLLFLIATLPVLIGAMLTVTLTLARCEGRAPPPVPFEDIAFPSTEFGLPTPAYFIPGAGTGADPAPAVIVLPTLAAARGDRMSEALVYHELGMHVLMFDSRACVGRTGPSLGVAEAAQVGDALAYLEQRRDVDPARIGLHGFSAGGAAALMAAAQFPEIAAVVAQGNFADFAAELDESIQGLGVLEPLFRFGARLGYRLMTGQHMEALAPIRAMPEIAPRPVLLVYGEHEPVERPEALAAAGRAAGSIVDIWIVPGARHGDYQAQAGPEYAERVGGFMAEALGMDGST